MCSVLTVKALKWYNDLEMNIECVVVPSHLRVDRNRSCSVTKFVAEKARIRIRRTGEQIFMCEKRKKNTYCEMLANEIVKSRHINISVLSLCVWARARARWFSAHLFY